MSWDDFYIGIESREVNSACLVEGNLSENSIEYWFSNDTIGGKINKGSKVGEKISEMIVRKDRYKKIEKYIMGHALATQSPEKLSMIISKSYARGYVDGTDAQKQKTKKAIEQITGCCLR